MDFPLSSASDIPDPGEVGPSPPSSLENALPIRFGDCADREGGAAVALLGALLSAPSLDSMSLVYAFLACLCRSCPCTLLVIPSEETGRLRVAWAQLFPQYGASTPCLST